jgi:hypothetical protein
MIVWTKILKTCHSVLMSGGLLGSGTLMLFQQPWRFLDRSRPLTELVKRPKIEKKKVGHT